MTTKESFRLRKMGGKIFSENPALTKADISAAIDELWTSGGPLQVKSPSMDDFGRDRTKAEVVDLLLARVPESGPGRRWLVRKQGHVARLVCRRVLTAVPTDGDLILQAALDQLGDDYNWADAGPDRFDCSGLVIYCHREVDITLPHSTYTLWHYTPQILHFTDRAKLKDGDIVFCDASDRPSPNHCGIADAPGQIVDASSTYDMIVHRPLDSNPVIGFGRIIAVNGPL